MVLNIPNTDNISTILFVYNAESGLLNAVADYVHKAVSPKTYGCNLCAITYSNTGMKKEWREYVKTLGVPVEFLHRDEFLELYNKNVNLPAAFLKKEDSVTLFIDSEEINALKTIEELMDLVTEKISKISHKYENMID
jgi:hypothetical protein